MNLISQNILEIKNLSVGFNIDDNFYYAIEGINLSFERGKIHCLVGESGCGKSVFISSILKLLPKNAVVKSGEIIFNGVDLAKIKEKDFNLYRGKNIFLIPQDPFMSLNPLYNVENQMLEVASLKDNPKQKEIIKNALEEVKIKNIDNVLKSYPHELSGGMKQRIIIAMALISGAELILADEPTTALDVSVSNSILNLLLDLKNKGKTIILITHDLSIASNYADSVNIMYLGKIVESANTLELFKNPLHPYTKALLGAIPNKKGVRLSNIIGQIPNIKEYIEGCKFYTRCEVVKDECKSQIPILSGKNHKCACLFANGN